MIASQRLECVGDGAIDEAMLRMYDGHDAAQVLVEHIVQNSTSYTEDHKAVEGMRQHIGRYLAFFSH